jgi:hypothetical protein
MRQRWTVRMSSRSKGLVGDERKGERKRWSRRRVGREPSLSPRWMRSRTVKIVLA